LEKIKIGCLTYKKLDVLTRQVISEYDDPNVEIVVIEGLMEDLIVKVKNAMRNGIDVLVGGGANAEIIRENIGLPVVKIKQTAIDYLEAIIKAKEQGKRIAVVNYQELPKFDFNKFKNLVDAEITNLVFTEQDELELKLKNLKPDVVVGASFSNEIANKLNIPGILIYPGKDTIHKSIQEAKVLAQALRTEKEKSKITNAMLNFSPSGIIATDEMGKIIIINPAAEKILGVRSNHVIGIPVERVMVDIDLYELLDLRKQQRKLVNDLNGQEIIVNSIPIEDQDTLVGTLITLERVAEIQKTEQRIRTMNKQKGFMARSEFSDIIGNSQTLMSEVQRAKRYARVDSNILIYGETGVGKEVFAQSIHNYSNRKSNPFIAINCAALPESLLESELFGYEEGSFTGSKKGGKVGIFELAHKGSIFLDEIGEVSPTLQARLLRVLQEKEVMRIGGDRIIPVDVRVIAATNKNLEEKIPDEFREDLFYRLNVLQINIPPLRKRGEDVATLFRYFLEDQFKIQNRKIELPEMGLEALKHYSWPGNIRQLQNIVERFFIEIQDNYSVDETVIREALIDAIGEDRLFNDILAEFGIQTPSKIDSKSVSKELLDVLLCMFPRQRRLIAEKLGLSRTTLWRIMNNE